MIIFAFVLTDTLYGFVVQVFLSLVLLFNLLNEVTKYAAALRVSLEQRFVQYHK